VVGFETENTITNTGSDTWKKDTGLLSIWILGMYAPGARTTVVIPVVDGDASELGPAVNADYFGKVPPDRLAVRDGVVYFRGDGQSRGKIGISPQRSKPVLGSYDPATHVLTVVQFTLTDGATDYVNSMWEHQEHPYAGDVVNSYNDGPPPEGPPLGPFYELESSSPAAALAPGESLTHRHRTIHIQGAAADLDPIARATLGVDIAAIVAGLEE
jgi:hypothetical protein